MSTLFHYPKTISVSSSTKQPLRGSSINALKVDPYMPNVMYSVIFNQMLLEPSFDYAVSKYNRLTSEYQQNWIASHKKNSFDY